ncbi:hypothetical protein F5B18DRAFT_629617 [Nemania serpens]|nr:hypothetical protein F5B18DRAFT_629617 [Nemania serpens]
MSSEEVSSDQVQLWPSQQSSLPAGNYILTAVQTIQPTEHSESLRSFPKLTQKLHVPGPKFKLLHASDIESVYPVPGVEEINTALAHVVLAGASLPWERQVADADDYDSIQGSKVPWLAVLSFTEDELILDAADAMASGFPAESQTSRFGTISTTAEKLKSIGEKVASPLSSPNYGQDYDDADALNALPLSPALFRQLFKPVAEKQACNDLSCYNLLAHVRKSSKQDGPISIIISPRSAPIGLTKPVRMVSHLVSLEGIPRLRVPPDASAVALISLHAWDWMCTPPAAVTPSEFLATLGGSVQPLRLPDSTIESVGKATTSAAWLHDRLEAGFIVKPYRALDGTRTACLIRGSLVPVLPTGEAVMSLKDSFDAASNLKQFDSATGLADLSLSSAWSLGRAMALGDKTFLSSLLRLRGQIRAAATRKAKAAARDASGGQEGWTNAFILKNLETVLDTIATAHEPEKFKLTDLRKRWRHSRQESSFQSQQQGQLVEFSQLDPDLYHRQLKIVVDEFFAKGTLNSDASAVLKWVLSRLFLEGIPPSYIVMKPDQLPPESIRTFGIDSTWLSLLIDGALSLANHHALNGEDDVIRKCIKDAIEKYLAQPLSEVDQVLKQPPRWGLLMRSSIVSSFPDLHVETVRSKGYGPDTGARTLFLRKVADDILLCLSDMLPGDPDFAMLRFTLPIHRQMYQVGDKLTIAELTGDFKLPPTLPDPSTYGKAVSCKWKMADPDCPYDLESRMLNPTAYMQQIYATLGQPDGLVDSTTVALFLGRPTPVLTLDVGAGAPIPSMSGPHLPVTPANLYETSPAVKTRTRQRKTSQRPASELISPLLSSVVKTRTPKAGDDIVVPLLRSEPLIYWCCPATTNVTDIFTPQKQFQLSTSNTNTTLSPQLSKTSIVFTLSDKYLRSAKTPNLRNSVEYVRVVIPAAASWWPRGQRVELPTVIEAVGGDKTAQATTVTIDTSHPSLVAILGSLSAPVLPPILSLDKSQQWTFRSYLALSRMYKTAGKAVGSEVTIPPGDPVVLALVVEGKPRFDLTKDVVDMSFVLESTSPLQTEGTEVSVNVIFRAQDAAVQELSVKVGPPT